MKRNIYIVFFVLSVLSSGCIGQKTTSMQSNPEEIVHYKDFVGVPKDTELGKLYEVFMKDLKDEDENDQDFNDAYLKFEDFSRNSRKRIVFCDYWKIRSPLIQNASCL